jgi:hypothetical protein
MLPSHYIHIISQSDISNLLAIFFILFLVLHLPNIASDDSNNNGGRTTIKNIGGRIIIFDDSINIHRRIIKIMEAEKLLKEINLTTFYILNKHKTTLEDKLKKMKERVQLLTIMDRLAIKRYKIIIASTTALITVI